MEELRFYQIHLDFHPSEHIGGIGAKFDKKQWHEQLLEAWLTRLPVFLSLIMAGAITRRDGQDTPGLEF